MGYIFEGEIEAIRNAVRARTIGEAESLQMEDLQQASVHPAIKAYFRNEVERLLQEERRKEVRSRRFPYGIPEVRSLQQQIDLILIQRYQFTQEEFENLLDQAVHFDFNYLCRPRWTLLNFVFEQRRTLPASDLYRKLRYCVDYAYFPRILKRYISEKGLAEVAYEEFKRVVDTIDTEVTARHSSEELAAMMRPLLEFVESGLQETPEAGKRSHLPVNAAVVFFEDKNLIAVKEALERKRDQEGIQNLTLEGLAALIADVRGETVAVAAPSEMTEEEGEEEGAEGASAPEQAQPRESAAPAAPVSAAASVPAATAPRLDDLYASFTPAVQKLFVRKIFRKDDVAFRQSLDRLKDTGSWEEAAGILDEIFQTNNIDPFSKEAVWFTDLLYAYFHPQAEE